MNSTGQPVSQRAPPALSLAAGLGALVVHRPAAAQAPKERPPPRSKPYTGGAAVQRRASIRLDIAEADRQRQHRADDHARGQPDDGRSHVTAVAVFNEHNPQRDVARFQLGPRAGRATVSTRIRLATTQQLVAIARLNDGSWWSRRVDVIVTLAACIED